MSSVTQRIEQIKQPRGGYLKPSQFGSVVLDDGITLSEVENVHPSIVGLAVDYLTRFMMGTDKKDAFQISLQGVFIAETLNRKGSCELGIELLKGITGLDDISIINACKLVTFDVWFRNTSNAIMSKGPNETNPDADTIRNIKILVERSLTFWKKYGPITKDGFTFESDGYTSTIDCGDGDYLTSDTIWDFKVSKSKPTSKHTLQLLIYWIMGQHSGQSIYKSIKKIGIYNPRLNIVYTFEITDELKDTIKEIEEDIICY